MKRFATTTTIRAPAARIWSLLTDAAGYPGWNSTVARINGDIIPGGRITVHVRPAAGRAFPLRVVEFEPARRMVWTGGMPFGLFVGRRVFTLAPAAAPAAGEGAGEGAVAFTMEEAFTGLLAPLIARSIPDLQPAFDRFAADLRHAAEAAG